MLWQGIALEALSGERRAQAASHGEGILISCCILCRGGGGAVEGVLLLVRSWRNGSPPREGGL